MEFGKVNSKKIMGSAAFKFENMQLIHIFTIGHSVTCVIISFMIYCTVKKSLTIDRRQYFFTMAVTAVVTVIYFFSLTFIVYRSTSQSFNGQYNAIMVLETLLDIIGSISTDPFSFLFALLMNFILLFGIFVLNLCSVVLADLAKSIEQRRTGGRHQNELELNNVSGS